MSKTEAENIDLKEDDKIAVAVRSFLEEEIAITTASGDQQSFFVKDLYFEKDYTRYERDLINLCKRNSEKVSELLTTAKEKFIEREQSMRHLANVEKWMVSITQSDLEHGKLKGDDLARHLSEIRRETKGAFVRDFDKIEEDNRPPVINGNLSSQDRNKVVDKKVIVKDNVRINNLDLEAFLRSKDGTGLNESEKKALRSRNEDLNKISNVYEHLAHEGLGVVNSAMRGIISDSSVLDDKRFKKYHQKRSEFVMDWARRNPSAAETAIVGDVEANLVELEREMAEEGLSADEYHNRKIKALRGRAELDMIKDFLGKKTKEMESQDGEVDAQLQEEFNKQNERLIYSEKDGEEGLNKLIKQEDDNHKWRIVCALLLLGPFAPAALIPINLLGPITSLITPIFSNGSLSAGLSTLLEIQGLGPITKLMELMNLAEYAEYGLKHCPIVSDLLGVMDGLLFNGITSGMMDVAGNPFIGSELFPLVIGGAFLAKQTTWEILHHNDANKAIKHHKNQQKNLAEKYEEQDDKLRKERSGDIANKHFEIMKTSNRDANLVQFIMQMKDDPDYSAYLDSVQVGGRSLKELLDHKIIGEKELLDIVKNPEMNKGLQANFLLYKAVATEDKTTKEILDEVKRMTENDPSQAQKLVSDQATMMDNNFIIEKAQDSGIAVTEKSNIATLQKELTSEIESRVEEVFINGNLYSRPNNGMSQGDGRNLALDAYTKTAIPNPSTEKPSATRPFQGRGPLSASGMGASA